MGVWSILEYIGGEAYREAFGAIVPECLGAVMHAVGIPLPDVLENAIGPVAEELADSGRVYVCDVLPAQLKLMQMREEKLAEIDEQRETIAGRRQELEGERQDLERQLDSLLALKNSRDVLRGTPGSELSDEELDAKIEEVLQQLDVLYKKEIDLDTAQADLDGDEDDLLADGPDSDVGDSDAEDSDEEAAENDVEEWLQEDDVHSEDSDLDTFDLDDLDEENSDFPTKDGHSTSEYIREDGGDSNGEDGEMPDGSDAEDSGATREAEDHSAYAEETSADDDDDSGRGDDRDGWDAYADNGDIERYREKFQNLDDWQRGRERNEPEDDDEY